MKRNYVAPQIALLLMQDDAIRTSTPETCEGFEKGWIS